MGRPFDPARATRARLLRLEEEGRAAAESRQVADGVAETVALDRRRGVAFAEKPAAAKGRPTQYRRQTGLEWLAQKGRINPAQAAAGSRYGASYRRANLGARIGSTLEIQPGAGAGGEPLDVLLKRAAGRQQAASRLASYRRRLWDQPDLVLACDRICGEELTPREAAGGEREAARLEAVLKVALDILAAFTA